MSNETTTQNKSRITTGLMSSNKQDWGTPAEFIEWIENHFCMELDLDVCAHSGNNKCDRYFTLEDDMNALEQDWVCVNGWMNPPFGNELPVFLQKCIDEVFTWGNAENIWVLVPARTDTKWFHELVVPWADKIYFIKGRFNFDFSRANKKANAPFPSILIKYSCIEEIDYQGPQMNVLNVGKKARGFLK